MVELGKQEAGMFRTPAMLIGLAGSAFLAGSLAPHAFTTASLAQTEAPVEQPLLGQQVASAAKSDRMGIPLPGSERGTVSVVELVGIGQATVILRGRDGEVLYRSDPEAGTTTFTKNTDLPVVTLKEEMQSPVVQHPVTRREGTEMPAQEPKKKRRNPVGCVGDLSSLVHSSADRSPSLCLALLDQSLS
jgi:hypothetical protein